MPRTTECSNPLRIDGRQGPRTRTLLFIIGLLCIAVPTWELRSAFPGFGFATLMLAGAWFIGALFVLGAIAGEDLRWTFDDDVLLIERSSPLRRRRETIRPEDVRSTEVRAQKWSDGPDKFSVVLHLRDGRIYETPALVQRAAAESLEADIRARLRVCDNNLG
jgi:hypothetical protein